MPLSNVGEITKKYRNAIGSTKANNNLTEEGKKQELKAISNSIEKQLNAWKEAVAEEQKKIDTALTDKKLTAKNSAKQSTLTAENIAVLTYRSKMLLSKLIAEGTTTRGFQNLMDELIQENDPTDLQAFVHSYADINTALANTGVTSYLQSYYREALAKLKTPEQMEYEEAKKEAHGRVLNLSMRLITTEQNTKDLKSSMSREVWSEEKPSSPWG